MDTIERLQAFMDDCGDEPGLGRHLVHAKRTAALCREVLVDSNPGMIWPPPHRFVAACAGAIILIVEQLIYPREGQYMPIPRGLNRFYRRLTWKAIVDAEFRGLMAMAWTSTLHFRQKKNAHMWLSVTLIGSAIERLLFGKTGGSGIDGFGELMGRTH